MSWPHGRVAVGFTFDFDAEEGVIADDPANADRPGVLSQGTFAAKVGVPLILDVLERCGVHATFFVPGRVAERHPERVRDIVRRGHEIGHHGYTHTSPTALAPEDEERELVLGREALETLGATVTGYRSPAWDFSAATLGLLERHGFAYSSNLMDDIRPYRHEGSSLIEVPIQWILDDAPHFWFDAASWSKKIATVEEVRSLWEHEVLGIRELGGAAVLTCHPELIGRPGRIGFLEAFIRWVQDLGDTWVATTGEIAGTVERAGTTG